MLQRSLHVCVTLFIAIFASVRGQSQCTLATSFDSCAELSTSCQWCPRAGACARAEGSCSEASESYTPTVFDCAGSGPAVWIELKNQALNPLRVELCASDPNNASQGACSGSDPTKPKHYTICTPSAGSTSSTQGWVNANTTVALRVPANTTYAVFVYCVELAGQSIHCLDSPSPPELYGPTNKGGHFPAVFATPVANASYCSEDKDCGPGGVCTNSSCPPAAFERGPRTVLAVAPRRAAVTPLVAAGDEVPCGWQVSLFCTVTFRANPSHNLTRSP